MSVAIFRPRGTTANTTKFEAWCMPSKATWRIYYTFYFATWRRKNWENVDAKKMLKYSLLLKHYLLMNETWMTDFSWQTCLACQVLNVGYEKCKMLLREFIIWASKHRLQAWQDFNSENLKMFQKMKFLIFWMFMWKVRIN